MALQASAAIWSVNGHEYTLVEASGITWANARAAAQSEGWDLVTITSQDEMDFLVANVFPVGAGDFWLGAFQTANQSQDSIGWNWVTGETWDYTNWRSGEPNDGGDNIENNAENHLMMYTINAPYIFDWNDTTGSYSNISGYIAERVVPVPGTFLILGAGLVGLAGLRRKQA